MKTFTEWVDAALDPNLHKLPPILEKWVVTGRTGKGIYDLQRGIFTRSLTREEINQYRFLPPKTRVRKRAIIFALCYPCASFLLPYDSPEYYSDCQLCRKKYHIFRRIHQENSVGGYDHKCPHCKKVLITGLLQDCPECQD